MVEHEVVNDVESLDSKSSSWHSDPPNGSESVGQEDNEYTKGGRLGFHSNIDDFLTKFGSIAQ